MCDFWLPLAIGSTLTAAVFYLAAGFWMMSAISVQLSGLAFHELEALEKFKFVGFALIWLPLCLFLAWTELKAAIAGSTGEGDR